MPGADYRRIVDDIASRIANGELRPEDVLPSYREMADQYDVHVSTVGRAIAILRDRGLVVGHPGRDTRVAGKSPLDGS